MTTGQKLLYKSDKISISQLRTFNLSLTYGDEHDLICIGQEFEGEEIVCLYSTERLMRGLGQAYTICIDTTYKLLISNFPVVVLGSYGFNNKFYLHAVGFTKMESRKSFSHCWNITIKYLESIKIFWRPQNVISD